MWPVSFLSRHRLAEAGNDHPVEWKAAHAQLQGQKLLQKGLLGWRTVGQHKRGPDPNFLAVWQRLCALAAKGRWLRSSQPARGG